MSEDQRYWSGIVTILENAGISPKRFKSWEDVNAAAVIALGGTCVCCKAPARLIGMWKPSDPTLLGTIGSRCYYLLCSEDAHAWGDVDRVLASRSAVMS